jgi:hypothetical protein
MDSATSREVQGGKLRFEVRYGKAIPAEALAT